MDAKSSECYALFVVIHFQFQKDVHEFVCESAVPTDISVLLPRKNLVLESKILIQIYVPSFRITVTSLRL